MSDNGKFPSDLLPSAEGLPKKRRQKRKVVKPASEPTPLSALGASSTDQLPVELSPAASATSLHISQPPGPQSDPPVPAAPTSHHLKSLEAQSVSPPASAKSSSINQPSAPQPSPPQAGQSPADTPSLPSTDLSSSGGTLTPDEQSASSSDSSSESKGEKGDPGDPANPGSSTNQQPKKTSWRWTVPTIAIIIGLVVISASVALAMYYWASPSWYLYILPVMLFLLLLTGVGYIFGWPWVGAAEYTTPSHPQGTDYHPPKTLWDWQQLLIIPVMLLLVTGWLGEVQTRNSTKASTDQYEDNKKLALDQRREDLLDSYLKDLSDFITKNAPPNNENLRASTITRTKEVLSRLDGERKGILLQSLYNGKLIQGEHPIIDLKGANLSYAQLSKMDLSGANLSKAALSNANLSEADLTRAYLWDTTLDFANLSGAKLKGAHLEGVSWCGTKRKDAQLDEADIDGAIGCKNESPVPRSCSSQIGTLEDDKSLWELHNDVGTAITSRNNTVEPRCIDSEPQDQSLALQISQSQASQYAIIHAYRPTLPSLDLSKPFKLSLSFYVTEQKPIQAFEVAVNLWKEDSRFQWALQWQQTPNRASQPPIPLSWYYWNGTTWVNSGPTKNITEGHWHTIILQGEIVNENGGEKVKYTDFSYDKIHGTLSDQSFNYVHDKNASANAGVLLIANAAGDPYDVYIDNFDITNIS